MLSELWDSLRWVLIRGFNVKTLTGKNCCFAPVVLFVLLHLQLPPLSCPVPLCKVCIFWGAEVLEDISLNCFKWQIVF